MRKLIIFTLIVACAGKSAIKKTQDTPLPLCVGDAFEPPRCRDGKNYTPQSHTSATSPPLTPRPVGDAAVCNRTA